MKKLFIYYSFTGNGDVIADKLSKYNIDIRKIETKQKLPKLFFFQMMIGGFKALIKYKDKLFDYDKDISSYDEIIITESMLDALSFWQVGKCAVALNGLGHELQFKQLRELPCRKLILATDNDERGLLARKRIRENVKNKLFTEYIFPIGRKDANDCTQEELLNLEEVF